MKGNTNMTHEEFNKQMLPNCAELLGHYLNVIADADQDKKQEVDNLITSAYNLGHLDCVNSVADHFGISLK
jgi:hypothetical protein